MKGKKKLDSQRKKRDELKRTLEAKKKDELDHDNENIDDDNKLFKKDRPDEENPSEDYNKESDEGTQKRPKKIKKVKKVKKKRKPSSQDNSQVLQEAKNDSDPEQSGNNPNDNVQNVVPNNSVEKSEKSEEEDNNSEKQSEKHSEKRSEKEILLDNKKQISIPSKRSSINDSESSSKREKGPRDSTSNNDAGNGPLRKGLENPPAEEENLPTCVNCQTKNIEFPVTFSCSHITCLQCIVHSLLLTQFKSIENRPSAVFTCNKCKVGIIEYSFPELIEVLKEMNQPKGKGVCRKHGNPGVKYCLQCELWLCETCIQIHSEFNSMHKLEETEHPIHKVCLKHGEITKFYCKNCKEEICPLCVIKGSDHYEHNFLPLEEFQSLTNEIRLKFEHKTFKEMSDHLAKIEEKMKEEYEKKTTEINETFDDIIKEIKKCKEDYEKVVSEKIKDTQYVIEIIRQCYCDFYNDLSKKDQDFYTLEYLSQVVEILTIKTFYTNHSELIEALEEARNFRKKEYYNYIINSIELPYSYEQTKSKYDEFKKGTTAVSREDQILNCIRFEKSIKDLSDVIYSIQPLLNNNSFAVSIGKQVKIFASETFSVLGILQGHTKNVLCLAQLSKNKLASGSEDKTVKIWNLSTMKCETTITGNYERIDSICVLEENKIALGSYNTIRVYSTDKKKELYSLIGHEKSVSCIVKVNPNIIVSGSYDNSIRIWNLEDKVCDYTLFGHDTTVFSLLVLRDGRVASGSGSWDKAIKIWNIKGKYCEFSLIGHKREVRTLKQLRNGWLLSGSVDKTIKVWNIKKKICLQTLVSHYDVIFSIGIISANRFVSGGRDKDLIVWRY